MIHRGKQSSKKATSGAWFTHASIGDLVRIEFPGYSVACCARTFIGDVIICGYLIVKEAISGALFGVQKWHNDKRLPQRDFG